VRAFAPESDVEGVTVTVTNTIGHGIRLAWEFEAHGFWAWAYFGLDGVACFVPPSLACVLLCFNMCLHIAIAVFGVVWHAVELCAYEVYSIILDVSSMLHMT
jgi:hypothetical protein